MKRYVQFLEISDDPQLMAQYRKWHSEEYHWKEIRNGIKEVGILEMELATLPRQAEWEAFVSKFQGCAADARSDEKWQPMERMFRLY